MEEKVEDRVKDTLRFYILVLRLVRQKQNCHLIGRKGWKRKWRTRWRTH